MSFKQALFDPTCFNNLNKSHKETWTCSSDNFQYLDRSDNLILSVKNFSVILCHGDVIQEARRGKRDCNSRFHHINLHSREQVVHVSLECLQIASFLPVPIASLLSKRSILRAHYWNSVPLWDLLHRYRTNSDERLRFEERGSQRCSSGRWKW